MFSHRTASPTQNQRRIAPAKVLGVLATVIGVAMSATQASAQSLVASGTVYRGSNQVSPFQALRVGLGDRDDSFGLGISIVNGEVGLHAGYSQSDRHDGYQVYRPAPQVKPTIIRTTRRVSEPGRVVVRTERRVERVERVRNQDRRPSSRGQSGKGLFMSFSAIGSSGSGHAEFSITQRRFTLP